MGRPINKKYLGSGSGDQIKVTFKVGGVEYTGYIVSQRSTRKFKVSDGTHTGICKLVNKAAGSLADNEMIVNVVTDTGETLQATKLFNRTMVLEGGTENGQRVPWSFDPSTSDDKVQVPEVDVTSGTITISALSPDSVTSPASGTFSVTASIDNTDTITYQWEVSTDSGSSWTAITGEVSNTLTVASTDDEYVTGNQFRVVVSSLGATASAETSNAVALTIA